MMKIGAEVYGGCWKKVGVRCCFWPHLTPNPTAPTNPHPIPQASPKCKPTPHNHLRPRISRIGNPSPLCFKCRAYNPKAKPVPKLQPWVTHSSAPRYTHPPTHTLPTPTAKHPEALSTSHDHLCPRIRFSKQELQNRQCSLVPGGCVWLG